MLLQCRSLIVFVVLTIKLASPEWEEKNKKNKNNFLFVLLWMTGKQQKPYAQPCHSTVMLASVFA